MPVKSYYIVHIFFIVSDQFLLLFQRNDNSFKWSPLSETFEKSDINFTNTVLRGIYEEVGLTIPETMVKDLFFSFETFSDKGKKIVGKSFYIKFSKESFPSINLNKKELKNHILLPLEKALQLQKYSGFKEAVIGTKRIIDIF